MNIERTYKVTMVNGPQTSIMPIKAHDIDHAMRIAKSMRLGLVVNIALASWTQYGLGWSWHETCCV